MITNSTLSTEARMTTISAPRDYLEKGTFIGGL
jgi:hypothetical protein